MNNIKHYFTSPNRPSSSASATPAVVVTNISPPSRTKRNQIASMMSPSRHPTRLADTPTRANNATVASRSSAQSSPAHSKLIVETMSSVISSVKKQQRRAKRKRRDADTEPEICDISDILSSSLRFVSPNVSGSTTSAAAISIAAAIVAEESGSGGGADDGGCVGKRIPATTSSKKPTSRSRSKTTRRSHKENACRTPSKSPPSTKKPTTTTPAVVVTAGPTTPKKNAFEMLMNARNKSIGTNSPAKDQTMVTADTSPPRSDTKTSRKLMMEAWADRKGAAKRRLQDDEAEEYVNKQMQKRAKRLKRLLGNGQRSTDAAADGDDVGVDVGAAGEATDDELVDVEQPHDLNGSFVKFNFKKFGKDKELPKKKRKSKVHVFESDDDNSKPGAGTTLPICAETVDSSCDQPTTPVPPTILTVLRSPPPSKSPHKPARRKSIYVPKTPTKSPRKLTIPKPAVADAVDLCLSSPIKKRDSLLGYFNKVDKSPAEDVAAASEPVEAKTCARKRGRPPKSAVSQQRESLERECTPPRTGTDLLSPSTDNIGSDQRPRRSCREKTVTYNAETNERSPAKVAAQKSIKRARRLLSGSSPQKFTSPGRSPRSSAVSNRKLAPIFVKGPVRPIVDPETARARQEFLMSGIPEKMRLDIERQKTFMEAYTCDLEVFPLVSHVTQLEAQPESSVPIIRYRPVDEENEMCALECRPFSLGQPTIHAQPDIILPKPPAQPNTALNLTKPKDLVKQLKELDNGKFLYFRAYKQLRRMYEDHQETAVPPSSSHTSSNDPESSNDSVEIIESQVANIPLSACNGVIMFTDKYKPANSDEVIVNSMPVFQLKRFLATWQENYAQRAAHHKRSTSTSTDDDDFEGGSNSASASLSKAVCLVGPSGVGKTNAVYALANEMHFNVLEINAGCKRTGKKMLQELHEATQSHQVKSGAVGGAATDRLFRSSQGPASSEESSSSMAASPKLSLILIEDADIVFDQDQGFVDAIFQLVATSKRPVILVANQRSCPHLARLIGHNTIDFETANAAHAGKWLSLMSIAEHRYVGHVDCTRLFRYNGCNMRRTMLDMQFFLQSGGDRERNADGMCGKHYAHQRLYESFAWPNGGQRVLAQPVDFAGVHDKTELLLGRRSDEPAANDWTSVLTYYDTMSAAQRLQSIGRRRQSRDGGDDGLTWNMAEDVTFEMADAVVTAAVGRRSGDGSGRFRIEPPSFGSSTAVKTNPLLSDRFAAAGLAHSSTHRRSVHLDVEPCLRTICRSEKVRTQSERTNRRFYHYLRNTISSSSFSTADTFDGHCDILWDEPAAAVDEV